MLFRPHQPTAAIHKVSYYLDFTRRCVDQNDDNSFIQAVYFIILEKSILLDPFTFWTESLVP